MKSSPPLCQTGTQQICRSCNRRIIAQTLVTFAQICESRHVPVSCKCDFGKGEKNELTSIFFTDFCTKFESNKLFVHIEENEYLLSGFMRKWVQIQKLFVSFLFYFLSHSSIFCYLFPHLIQYLIYIINFIYFLYFKQMSYMVLTCC